jgi:hypothetical protein
VGTCKEADEAERTVQKAKNEVAVKPAQLAKVLIPIISFDF